MKIAVDPAGIGNWKKDIKCDLCHCVLEIYKDDIKQVNNADDDDDHKYYVICMSCSNTITVVDLHPAIENYIMYKYAKNF